MSELPNWLRSENNGNKEGDMQGSWRSDVKHFRAEKMQGSALVRACCFRYLSDDEIQFQQVLEILQFDVFSNSNVLQNLFTKAPFKSIQWFCF